MARVQRTVVAAAVAAAALVGVVGPVHAAATKSDTVGARMAPGSKGNDGYYAFNATPGSTTTQTVIVSNDQTHAIEADVGAVAASTASATGVAYGTPGSAPTGTAGWIEVQTPVVTLQPGEQRPIDFTVRVPADATPGVHLAGIGASAPRPKNAPPTVPNPRGATFNITLQPERVIAVEVTVPGPKSPRLVITGAHAIATPSGIALVLAMANKGNDYARGSGVISVPDTKFSTRIKLDTFVPSTKIRYQLPWTKTVFPGTHAVSAILRYDGRQLAWNGNVVINAATQRELQASLDKTRLPGHSSGFPLLLALLAVGVVVLLALSVAVVRRRRGVAIRVVGTAAQPADAADSDRDLSQI